MTPGLTQSGLPRAVGGTAGQGRPRRLWCGQASLAAGVLLSLGAGIFGGTALAGTADIDATHKYAWSENAGWLNFRASHGYVEVFSDHLEGYAWNKNIGWIRLGSHTGGGAHTYANSAADNWGVNHDGSGVLSGYAWSENLGWIKFNPANGGVTINLTTGEFDGYAWAKNLGWLHFRQTTPVAYKVNLGDSNSDGEWDYADTDDDGDGMPDTWETDYGFEPLNPADGALDSDSDGLTNAAEYQNNTFPADSDSDDDGLNDGAEVNTYTTDPRDSDTDNDGLSDGAEANTHGTNPKLADSDGDGLSDGAEINTFTTNPKLSDTDGDGLSDGTEINTSLTDPTDYDQDNDGLGDGKDSAPAVVKSNSCSGSTVSFTQSYSSGEISCRATTSIASSGTVTINGSAEVGLVSPKVTLAVGFKATTLGAGNGNAYFRAVAQTPPLAREATDATPVAARTSRGTAHAWPTPMRLVASRFPEGLRRLLDSLGAEVEFAEADAVGRYLVFATDAALAERDGNGVADIYLYDDANETLTLVSANAEGIAGGGASTEPRIDGYGRYLSFQSDAADLVADDRNGVTDIFLYDIAAGVAERASRAEDGGESLQPSRNAVLGGFEPELVYDRPDGTGLRDIYRQEAGALPLAERLADGIEGVDLHHPALSADGRYLAYLASGTATGCLVVFEDLSLGLRGATGCPTSLGEATGVHPQFDAEGRFVDWWVQGGAAEDASGMAGAVRIANPFDAGTAPAGVE